MLAIASRLEGGCFYAVATGKEVGRWKGSTQAMAFAPDGKTLAIAVVDERVKDRMITWISASSVRLVDVATAAEIHNFGKQPHDIQRLADLRLTAKSGHWKPNQWPRPRDLGAMDIAN